VRTETIANALQQSELERSFLGDDKNSEDEQIQMQLEDQQMDACGVCLQSTNEEVLLLSCCRKLIHKGCYNEKVRQTYDLAKKKQEVINLGSGFPDDRKTQKIFIEAQRGTTAISCPYCRGIPELLNID
jgi:hypothetical protein